MEQERNPSPLKIGCFADTFSGACEIASYFSAAGLNTALVCGQPRSSEILPQLQALVFPLDIASVSAEAAAQAGLDAYSFLKQIGTAHIYFKLSSRLDNMEKAVAVVERILKEYHIPYTLFCPASPERGFTVENGAVHLHGLPLEQGNLLACLKQYGQYPPITMAYDLMAGRPERREQYLVEKNWKHPHFYLVPDYNDEEDGQLIVRTFSHLPLLAGSSGVGRWLAVSVSDHPAWNAPYIPSDTGRCLVFAGSRSPITAEQACQFIDTGRPSYKIDPALLQSGEQSTDALMGLIRGSAPRHVLLYGVDLLEPSGADDTPRLAATMEKALGALALRSVESGITKIIVSGENTCRAVLKALGANSFHVGPALLPGVAVLTPLEYRNVRLVLKAGDVGSPDFFLSAIQKLTP